MDKAMLDILTPILEGSIVLAAHYAKSCDRTTVTALDIEYAMKYSAQHEVGTHVGSIFPEMYDDSDSDESLDVVDDDDEPFTRYSGNDEWCNKMNTAYDTWDSWIPGCPVEILIKNAIDQKKSLL